MRPLRQLTKRLLGLCPTALASPAASGLARLGLAHPGYAAWVSIGQPTEVLAGDFAGLRLGREAAGSALYPKVAGTYELELAATFASLPAPTRFVDIGAAEGYYAVGLARRWPAVEVLALDTDPRARALCRRNAMRNGVAARVEVPESWDWEGMVRPGDLLLCDVEGAEDALIDPERAPGLRGATLIIEHHEHLAPGSKARLRARFAASHALEELPGRARRPEDLPAALAEGRARGLSTAARLALMDEGRHPEQGWYVLRPLSSP